MSVLILGATSPIARAVCHEYAAQGRDIFVAARDADEAERIAADVEIRFGVKACSAAFDALDFDQHPAFVTEVEHAVGPLSVAIVAFGDMGEQTSSEADFKQAKRVIDVNYTGAASICEAVAQVMLEREQGAIIGITSVAGERGRQSNYFYGSAKGAFTLYLQGLRNRLHPLGVNVLTVKLGFVDTRMTFGMETAIPIASPQEAARAIVAAQERGENEIFYPRFWRGIMGVIKAIPEGLFKRLTL